MRAWILVALAACSGASRGGATLALRPACEPVQYWDGTACKPRGNGAAKIAAGKDALVKQEVEQAKAALDEAAERGGPLDYETNVTLWEQRGIALAFLEDQKGAAAAFDMLLALDPAHFLSYTKVRTEVTFIFEQVRNTTKASGSPAVDVNWPSGQKVGDPVPLDIEVLADPKRFLKRATVFVRARGETAWRAADVPVLAGNKGHLVLPGVQATAPTSLELYLRAYDDRNNEVLVWADPARPREIPLRYDPPPAWYRNWKLYAVGVPVAVVLTGAIVYALTLAPPDDVGGNATLRRY
ncbi:MAG: hypothetical protein ABI867_39975 [Kofleriaceae bacterium]